MYSQAVWFILSIPLLFLPLSKYLFDELLWGEDMAKMTQLIMEYNPQPPFNGGCLETANKSIVQSLNKLSSSLIKAFWTGIKK